MERVREVLKSFKKVLLRHKKETAIISSLFVMVVAIGVTCAFNVTKDIEIVVDENTTSVQNSTKTEVVTAQLQRSVEEVLQEQGYSLSEEYSIDVGGDKKVKDVDTIVVKRNAVGAINVEGTSIPYKSGVETVGDLLAENDIAMGSNDFTTPAMDEPLTADITQIDVTRVSTQEIAYEAPVPFEVEEKQNPSLSAGTRTVTTPGANGTAAIVDKVIYHNGVEASRSNVSRNITVAPVKEIAEVGNAVAAPAAPAATPEAPAATPEAPQADSNTAAAAPSAPAASPSNATQSIGSDFEMICAIVAHEGGPNYEGALAVISCVMNRIDEGGWGGSDALSVLTASGQFASYLDGHYTQYMGNTPECVQQAVRDCMEGGVRSHSYSSFRSYQTSGSVNIGGNWFF